MHALALATATSMIQSSSTCLEVFAARDSQKGEAVRNYCGMLVYHHLSFRKRRKKTYGDVVLNADVAPCCRYALQFQVHERRFKRTLERLENRKRMNAWARLFLCVCAHQRPPLRRRR